MGWSVFWSFDDLNLGKHSLRKNRIPCNASFEVEQQSRRCMTHVASGIRGR